MFSLLATVGTGWTPPNVRSGIVCRVRDNAYRSPIGLSNHGIQLGHVNSRNTIDGVQRTSALYISGPQPLSHCGGGNMVLMSASCVRGWSTWLSVSLGWVGIGSFTGVSRCGVSVVGLARFMSGDIISVDPPLESDVLPGEPHVCACMILAIESTLIP